MFHALEQDHEYNAEAHNKDFYILTNWQAKNFRLMKVKQKDADDKSKWEDVISHSNDVLINDFVVFDKHLVVRERKNGLIQIRFFDLATMISKTLAFEYEVFSAGLTRNVSAQADKVRLYYSSLTTPKSIFDIDLITLKRELLKQDKVLGEFDPSNYFTERKYVKARDGVDVPVSLVYRKDKFKKDGTNPLYQYGYVY